MRRWRWLGLGLALVGVLALLVASAPARLLLDRLHVPGLQVGAVNGSIWHGGLDEVRYRGQALGSVRWRLRPLPLLRLALVAKVEASGGWGEASALFSRRGDALNIEALRGQVDARLLTGLFASPEVIPMGRIEFSDGALAWQAHAVTRLAGSARWRDAALAGLARASLGELHADLLWDAPNVGRIVLGDAGGPLALRGTVWLSLLGWHGDLTLAARDPALVQGLAWIGQAQADGSRRLLLQGGWSTPQ